MIFSKKKKQISNDLIHPSMMDADIAKSIEECQLNGMFLEKVENQTELICIVAIKQNATAFRFVKEQNENLCLLAVKRNGLMLQFVKEQTEDICKAAIAENPVAIKYVKDNNLKKKLQENDNRLILHPELSLDDVLAEAEKIKTVKPPTGSFDSEMKMRSR